MRLMGESRDHHRRRPGHRSGDRDQVREGRRQGRGLRPRRQNAIDDDLSWSSEPAARRWLPRRCHRQGSIAAMVDGVMAKWGRVDCLVNNAGIVAGRAAQEHDRRPVRQRDRRST